MEYQPKFNEKKATEAASILLALKKGKVEYIWLLKMLYIIDREALNRWERPITYDSYRSLARGPVPMTIYNLITGKFQGAAWTQVITTYPFVSEDRFQVSLNGPTIPRLRLLSKNEDDLIREKFKEFENYTIEELIQYTHDEFAEWTDPEGGPSTPIEIDRLLAHLNFSEDDIDRIKTELRDEETANTFFGR